MIHADAQACWRGLSVRNVRIVLTNWIIAETGNGLARTGDRAAFVRAVRLVLASPRAEVVPVDSRILDRALALYDDRPDKTWGLIDCASFVVMQERSIAEALTTDRHFEQAGFKCLLSSI